MSIQPSRSTKLLLMRPNCRLGLRGYGISAPALVIFKQTQKADLALNSLQSSHVRGAGVAAKRCIHLFQSLAFRLREEPDENYAEEKPGGEE